MKKTIILSTYFIFLTLSACNDQTGDSIQDTTPPVVTLNGDAELTIGIHRNYAEAGAIATDNIDGLISVTIKGLVDTTTAGTYMLTYTATDTAGNTSAVNRT